MTADPEIYKPDIVTCGPAGGWSDSYAYVDLIQDLRDYSQILVTFSYTPGYTFGFGFLTKGGDRVILEGSDASWGTAIDHQTAVYDIPADCNPHRLWFRAGSMMAVLYIHELKLIR